MYDTDTEAPIYDPGTEVTDLSADQGLTAKEAKAWADVEPEDPAPIDLARATGFVSDYQWAGWLVKTLRAAGCNVIAYPGWRERGRPRSTGPFTPHAVIWHHDGSAVGPSPALARFLAEEGRPAEGIPAPLSQLWVCEGCNGQHPAGTWHVLAAGRANHAGEGDGFGTILGNAGNAQAFGVETDNTTGEPTPTVMYDALCRGTRALLDHLGADVEDGLCGHKEYAAGRKSDPDDIDMAQARADVAHEHRIKAYPGREHFTTGHECKKDQAVRQLEQWLLALPANARATHEPSPEFSRWTREKVKAFQAGHGIEDDGEVTELTWRHLQRVALR